MSNIYINDATTAIGRTLTALLVSQGHSVSARVDTAAQADGLRQVGALPVYGDATRTGEVLSTLRLTEAEVVVNLLPQTYNQVPWLAQDWDSGATAIHGAGVATAEAVQQASIKRYLTTSFAYLYRDNDHAVDETAKTRKAKGNAWFHALLEAETAAFGAGATVFRLGHLYSAEAHDPIRQLEQVVLRANPTLTGSKAHLTNWTRAESAARALAGAVQADTLDSVYNLVDHEAVSAYDVLSLLSRKLGLSTPPSIPNFLANLQYGEDHMAVLHTNVSVSNERVKTALNWKPRFHTMDASLEDVLLTWRATAVIR